MSASDWITAAIALGGLVVAITSLVKSSRTDRRQAELEKKQARLAEFQIAEHQDRAEKKAEERESEEFGRLFHEALKEHGRVRKPDAEPEGG